MLFFVSEGSEALVFLPYVLLARVPYSYGGIIAPYNIIIDSSSFARFKTLKLLNPQLITGAYS